MSNLDNLEAALQFTEKYEGGVPHNRWSFAQALSLFASQAVNHAVDEQRKLRPEAYDDLLAACEGFADVFDTKHHTATWSERLAHALSETQAAIKKAKG